MGQGAGFIENVVVHSEEIQVLNSPKHQRIHLFLNNQADALIIQIYSVIKKLHVSGIPSAHHQEFCTVHSALVSFMQVFDNRYNNQKPA